MDFKGVSDAGRCCCIFCDKVGRPWIPVKSTRRNIRINVFLCRAFQDRVPGTLLVTQQRDSRRDRGIRFEVKRLPFLEGLYIRHDAGIFPIYA